MAGFVLSQVCRGTQRVRFSKEQFVDQKRRLIRFVLLALVLLPIFSTATPLRVDAKPAAPTLTVNVGFDDVARSPYDDGVCDIPIYTGPCTLRAAIIKANHYPGGGVTINVPMGTYTLTIAPDIPDNEFDGDLNITNTMTINGVSAASTIINANHISTACSMWGQASQRLSPTLRFAMDW